MAISVLGNRVKNAGIEKQAKKGDRIPCNTFRYLRFTKNTWISDPERFPIRWRLLWQIRHIAYFFE